jgi:hypothetical protein
MLGRAWAALGVLLAAGLAGCIGGPAEEKAHTLDVNATGTVGANETAAPDGRGDISAFKESNKTEVSGQGAMMHAHDYWKGETRKVIWTLDAGLIPLPLMPDGKAPGTAIADFDIPAPNLVYEGTEHLEVLFKDVRPVGAPSGTPHPFITVKLDYLTSADEPGKFRSAGDVTPGQALIIKVKPTEADMPHSTKSLWLFRIYTGEANGFEFNITVTAVKGYDVVNWPPHPNLYADKIERLVFDADARMETQGWSQYWISGTDNGWVYPERVISYGTDRVDVTIAKGEITMNGAAPPRPPDEFLLEFHNASYLSKVGNGDLAGGRLDDKGSDGKTYHFSIKVDNQGMDSPYGQKSRWAFRFIARYSGNGCVDDGQGFTQGCQFLPYEMAYHMKIVATGHSTATGVETPT